jgi:trk system potassium uptake protein TrkA
MLPSRESVMQEGDILHLVMREEKASGVYDVLQQGPEDD